MPQRPPRLADNLHTEGRTRRPLIRLYRVPETALKQISFSGSGVQSGERLVFAIDAQELADRSLGELVSAFRAVVKNLRRVREVEAQPSPEALKVHWLKTREEGGKLTVRQIAKLFKAEWRDCNDVESRERRVKRHLATVKKWLAHRDERAQAGLTSRQRAILTIAREHPAKPE